MEKLKYETDGPKCDFDLLCEVNRQHSTSSYDKRC